MPINASVGLCSKYSLCFQITFQGGCTILYSHRQRMNSPTLDADTNILVILIGVWCLIVILSFPDGYRTSFHVLVVFLLWWNLLMFFVHLIGLFVFLLFSFENSFYILDELSDRQFASIFSQAVVCLSFSSLGLSQNKKFYILMKFNLPIFKRIVFDVKSKNTVLP